MKIIPPVIAALYLGAAAGIDRLLPSDRLIPASPGTLALGALLAASGVTLAALSAWRFRRYDTTVHPHGEPTTLVTDGPFSWTRNPMYTGVTLVLLGIGVSFGSAVFVAVPVAFLLTMNRWFVPREEAKLTELFGVQFEEYKGRVRRWI